MRLAESHADWVLGYQDETWWSRLASPFTSMVQRVVTTRYLGAL